jgi:predicted lipoprotein
MRRLADRTLARTLATPLLAAALLAAEASGTRADAISDHQKAVVTKAVENYIRPSYATFRDRAERLNGAVGTFCRTRAASDHTAVAAAFRDAVEAWARLDFLRFGPAAREARLERVAFWPDPRGFVERQLRQLLASDDLATLDAARIAGQSAAVQGLPALERLVVAIPAGVDPPDLDRRCIVATAAAGNVAAIAAELDAAWRDGDVLLLTPGPGNPAYRTSEEAANEVLKASLTGLEQLRDLALRPALGDAPDKAKPNRFPYAKSGNTIAYLAAAVAAQDAFIAESGIAAGLPEADRWAERSVHFELGQAGRTVATLRGSDLAAIATEPALRGKLDYVTIALASVRTTMATTIAADLGLSVGFNALDGD